MTTLLGDLLPDRTKADEEQILLSVFQGEEFQVSDWNVGGVARTMAKAIAAAMLDKYQLVQTLAKGQLTELAKALKDAAGNEVRVWLDAIATHFYQLTRAPATFTVQRCVLTCEAGFGPITISNGFIARALPSGNRYVYQGPTLPNHVPDGGSATVDLTAEEAGAKYADPAGSIVEPVTSLPGLSINNPATKFGGLEVTGVARKSATAQGTGTVTPAGNPVQTRSYSVTVVESGTAGSSGKVKFAYLANGVSTAVATVTPIPASYAGLGDGITLTLVNGGGAGFIAGDVHTFQTPGSPIVSQGVDVESNEKLAQRIKGRWPSLAVNMVVDKHHAMITQASLDGGYGIEKITIQASVIEAGVTNILVATATGAPPSGTLTALQDYIDARTGIGDKAFVAGAVDRNVPISGTVTVKASALNAVQAAADTNWRNYITALPIGGDLSTGFPGYVRLAELGQALMDAGAIDYDGLELDGSPTNMTLDEEDVAVIDAGQEPSLALIWNVVA